VMSVINVKYDDVTVESTPQGTHHTSDSGDSESTGIRSVATPAVQPALAPRDYSLFGQVKKMLGGQKFASDTEVHQPSVNCLDCSQHRSFPLGILVDRCDRWELDKCLNEYGRYQYV